MRTVWLCVRAGLRQDWRGLALLTLITAVMGAVVLTALAGARRTDTAVAQFLQYAGPIAGTGLGRPRDDRQDRRPARRRLHRGRRRMLAGPVSVDGRPTAPVR